MVQLRRNQILHALRAATDKELADYMAGFHSGSKEWVMCQQELARRQGAPAALGRRAGIAIGIFLAALLLLLFFNLPVGHGKVSAPGRKRPKIVAGTLTEV